MQLLRSILLGTLAVASLAANAATPSVTAFLPVNQWDALSALLEDRQGIEVLIRRIETLDEERRVLFISQLLEHLSAAESAELLGIDTASVYHRVRDLRRSFKRWLQQRLGEDSL